MLGVRTRCAAWAALTFLCVVGGGAADERPAAAAPDSNTILSDPSIRLGVLPNGLRFAVMHNSTPAHGLSLRLAVDVGTYDEESGEHGAAHFVEHMAFSGGDNAHEAGSETKFAAAGVEFGRDQNASTGLFATTYRLDLPSDDAASLDLAFGWLRKVADGAVFSDVSVNRERDIVSAERQVSLGAERLAQEDSEKFLTPGLRAARPDSIGTPAELRALSGPVLDTFYHRWYRPENAVVVAVGDESEDALEQRVRDTFGTWQGQGAKPVRVAFGAPDEHRALDVRTRAEPRLSADVSICRVAAASPHAPDDVVRLRKGILTALWIDILNRRLAALTRPDDAPFFSSEAFSSAALREARETCIVSTPLFGEWRKALRVSEIELRRFAEQGATEKELDDAVDVERASLRGAMRTAATRTSSSLAGTMLGDRLAGDVTASPTEAFRAFDVAVEKLTPRDVSAAFAEDWSGGGPLVSLSTSDLVSQGSVRQVWNDAERAALAPAHEVEKPAEWAYTSFGVSGHVAKRETIPAPEFTRITFDNGVILNFKRTDYEREIVKVRLQFGAGRREIPTRRMVAAELGSHFLAYMGLGRNDVQDLQELFAQMGWDATMHIQDDSFALIGSTTQRDLKAQMQILAAFVTDPGFRATYNARLPTLVDYYYRRYRSDPGSVLRFALESAVGREAALGLPPKRELLNLKAADFEKLLKPALQEAPLEVTVVGDVDEAAATEYVAETFGALPKRSPRARDSGEAAFLHFPDHAIPLVRATHEGPTDIAVVGVDWPLYVAVPERRREEVSLMLLRKVFDNRLRHRVRQEMGRSYSPTVEIYTPDNADQGYIEAMVETSPGDADLVRSEIKAIATQLARGDISDEEIEAARHPIVADFAATQKSNDWWVGGLDGSAHTPARLDEMNVMMPLLTGVTPQEVRKAAADWLVKAPVEIVALPTPSNE